ncbi:MAG TPA: hypothetical protein VFE62_23410 [Gemmataceae bacterium]|nr:hypothetical protein [Gemmataceae bacterium]
MPETYGAKLRRIYTQFIEHREHQGITNSPVNLNDVYQYACSIGWQEPQSDPKQRFRKDMARALREDHFTDFKGRVVRRYHARKCVYIDSEGAYVQEVLWDDMLNDPTPVREHMEASFTQRRNQAAGELHQLKNDVDHYNDRNPGQSPILMLWDFTGDMNEQDQPTEYCVPPIADDEMDESDDFPVGASISPPQPSPPP